MNQSEEKRPLGKIAVEGNTVLIYSLKNTKTGMFSICNLHKIPTLKKSFNILSSVTFLVNVRMIHVINGNITFHLIIS